MTPDHQRRLLQVIGEARSLSSGYGNGWIVTEVNQIIEQEIWTLRRENQELRDRLVALIKETQCQNQPSNIISMENAA